MWIIIISHFFKNRSAQLGSLVYCLGSKGKFPTEGELRKEQECGKYGQECHVVGRKMREKNSLEIFKVAGWDTSVS